jgi:hypothetical protein
MRTSWRRFVSAIVLMLCVPLIGANVGLFAWQNRAQNQQSTTTTNQNKLDDRAHSDLSAEIRNLTNEIKELHKSQRQMLDVMLLQIEETRADKLADKVAASDALLRALLAQEAQLEFRLGHLENELIMRNIVNRQEGEQAVRAELQAAYDQVKAERERAEAEQKRLREQFDEVNHRLELIHARLNPEIDETEGVTSQDANITIVPNSDKPIDRPQASPAERPEDPQK